MPATASAVTGVGCALAAGDTADQSSAWSFSVSASTWPTWASP